MGFHTDSWDLGGDQYQAVKEGWIFIFFIFLFIFIFFALFFFSDYLLNLFMSYKISLELYILI